ncbi:Nucleoporin NUP49 [Pleurostoma richardsiae]|uniref:Nucleoporin NUP49 n=1 Tax=Pleurostoma richardsiae TaxID=41990 RepID=A0AA38VDV9_9PEZI|nr:Nucleoporin NUP49 [Pleurostoma richardsiae]
MALARSASGPGGLSINTGSANLFGTASSQPPAAGGLFGSAQSSQQPAQSGGLFGAAPAQPSQPTGSMFGGAASSQQQQAGGLFGSRMAAPQQQTGGLFGSAATAQPQQTGGLFGSTTQQQPLQQTGGLFGGTQPQQQQQQQQQTGGLFGSTAAAQPQQQQTGGLFGSSTQQPAQSGGLFGGATQQQQQQQRPGGLFGASTAQPAMTGGLFGQSQQQQPQQQQASGGLFGQSRPTGGLFSSLNQSTQQPQANALGQTLGGGSALGPGLTMGQSTSSSQQVVPGVRIDLSNIKSTTRFNDLQEDLQKEIANIDRVIQGCIAQKNELDAFMPAHGEQLASIPTDVRFVSRKYAGVDGALAADAQAIRGLRELVKVDADHARLSFKAVDNLKLPAQYHTAGLWSTRSQGAAGSGAAADAESESNSDLVSFFSRTADEMDEQMKKFQKNLAEIEMHLGGVQSNLMEQVQRLQASKSKGASAGTTEDRIAELAGVLRDFEDGILKVAGQVGGVREGVTELQLGEFRNGVH